MKFAGLRKFGAVGAAILLAAASACAEQDKGSVAAAAQPASAEPKSVAAAALDVTPAQLEALKAALENPAQGLQVESVKQSEIAGLFEVQYARGPLVYATADGSFFIVGDMYSTGGSEFVNLTESRRDLQRLARLSQVPDSELIVFSPEGETRAFVYVFTDITCGYCRKLHQEMADFNDRGIEVRYLAYPRTGLGTDGAAKLATAWCADNRQEALTQLKNGQSITSKVCADNPVADHFALGQELGVRGTPAIVTQAGALIPGYQTADQLSLTLGLN